MTVRYEFERAISNRVATTAARNKALGLGFELTNELAQKILTLIKDGGYVWADPKNGAQSAADTAVYFINHASKRMRVVVSIEIDRIIVLDERDWIITSGARKAESIPGLTLNMALGTLILGKIRAGEAEISTTDEKPGTALAFVEVGDVMLRVIYDLATGTLVRVGLKATSTEPRVPRIRSEHPNASQHATQRAVERFEVMLDKTTTETIIRKIKTNQVEDRYPLGAGKGGAVLEIAPGKRCVVVFDQTTYSLITVTPIEAYERHMDKKTKREDRFKARKKESAKHKRAVARSED